MTAQQPLVFFLRQIDRSIGCAVAEMRVCIADLAGLRDILGGSNDADLAFDYDLIAQDVARIAAICVPPVALDARLNSIEPWHPMREGPYLVHTGYELPLMLEGRKPLAVFADVWPAPWLEELLQRFEPYVQTGRFIRRIVDDPLPHEKLRRAGYLAMRRVLFSLPGQEWRIEAYLDLWRGAEATRWGKASERREGELLGYEDWQNDWWVAHRRPENALPPPAPDDLG
jgi:hypothetical protein